MKKIILLLLGFIFTLQVSFAIVENNEQISYKQELTKYWGENAKTTIDNFLEKWNDKVLKLEDFEKITNKYDEILGKIQNALAKKMSNKIKIVLIYLEYKINNFRQDYVKNYDKELADKVEKSIEDMTGTEDIQGKNIIDLSGYNFNYKTLKRDEIIVPLSGSLEGILGFYIKSLYGDSLAYSFLFSNEYGNEADYNIKNVYLLSSTGAVLGKSKMVNGKIYFDLGNKPAYLMRNWNTSFYVFIELNNVNGVNQTNKRIKLKLLEKDDTYETKIITKVNGNKAYFSKSFFNANTYFIRKSKPIFKSVYTTGRLRRGTNDIFKFNIASTGNDITIKKLNFNINISNAYVDTGDVLVYIDGKKYTNLKAYFDDIRGDTKLHIIFNGAGYKIGDKSKEIRIQANFTKVYDNGYILTRLRQKSSNTDLVDGNYNGETSILYSDEAVKGSLTENDKDYFTDAKLYFDNMREWYLKDR